MVRYFTDRFIMTPGPSGLPERVKAAMLRAGTNPDLDPGFMEEYEALRRDLRGLLGATKSSLYVMLGEAILGLEAAIANLVPEASKVIVVSNGVFGEAFGDLVESYGAKPALMESDWRKGVSLEDLDRFIERNKDSVAVTLVHCDTPSAILNDLEGVARVVRDHGLLLIVDAVSTVGALRIDVDSWGVDVLIGGSQKALNSPPGITIMTVSDEAWRQSERRGYRGYYLGLEPWRRYLDGEGVFPYTMSDPLIYALRESVRMVLEEGPESVYRRHEASRRASWAALEALGLEPYPESLKDSSTTVTAFTPPRGVDESELRRIAWEKYGVLLAGSWGKLEGRVVRVGHMGVQASLSYLAIAYTALARSLSELGYKARASKAIEALEEEFR